MGGPTITRSSTGDGSLAAGVDGHFLHRSRTRSRQLLDVGLEARPRRLAVDGEGERIVLESIDRALGHQRVLEAAIHSAVPRVLVATMEPRVTLDEGGRCRGSPRGSWARARSRPSAKPSMMSEVGQQHDVAGQDTPRNGRVHPKELSL